MTSSSPNIDPAAADEDHAGSNEDRAGSNSEAPEQAAQMTPEEQAEAHRYGRIALRSTLIDLGIDLVYLAAMAFLFVGPLDNWLATFTPLAGEFSYQRLAVLVVLIYCVHAMVSLPLSYYSGYIIEHRFGLSNQSAWRWIRNWLLSNSLALLISVGLYMGLYAIIWNTGGYWWLIAAAVFYMVAIVSAQLFPVLIMPLFYKVRRLASDDPLIARVRHLAAEAGLNVEGVYRLGLSVDTKKANAMLAGLGRTRRVLLGDTLLDKFSADEIEVIFAHEVGHHAHRHAPKLLVFGAVFSLVGFWLCDRLLVGWTGQAAELAPPASLPIIMLGLKLFSLVMMPLQNAISRRFERQSDRYALDKTGLVNAYRSAFRKLARLNKDDPNPHPLEVVLLDSHPPISERLAMADQ